MANEALTSLRGRDFMVTTPSLADRRVALDQILDAIGKLDPASQRSVIKAALAFLGLRLYEGTEGERGIGE